MWQIASIPILPFETTFNAFDDSAKCPQVDEFSNQEEGTLDCLHINIYVPNNATTRSKLPVLVWIYGGRFSLGYSGRYLYGAKYLVRNNIILVTFNYRLGPYGFLCLNIPEVPGNQGMKDQVSALRWVRDNIEAFGGDVDQITAAGNSAGSISVELHILSESEKLFNKAILQSGSALTPTVLKPQNNTIVLKICEKLGFLSNDLLENLLFLSLVDPKLVVSASNDLNIEYRPCLEKTFDDVEPFLIEHPETANFSKAKNMAILIGYNSKEKLRKDTDYDTDFLKDTFFHDTLLAIFNLEPIMVDIVSQFYIGDERISKKVKFQLVDFLSDVESNYPTHRSIIRYLRSGAASVYHYIFSYSGHINFVKKIHNITEYGAAHADEISYLFDLSYDKNVTNEDQLIIDRITTLWTNFVKHSNPTPEESKLIPIKWPPITEKVLHYLDINTELSMGARPFHKRLAFWDLFFGVNGKKLRTFTDNNSKDF